MAIEVVPLTEADIPGAIEVIQQAFADDPYFKWVFDASTVCRALSPAFTTTPAKYPGEPCLQFNAQRNHDSLKARCHWGIKNALFQVAKETSSPDNTSNSTSPILGVSCWLPPHPPSQPSTWSTWFQTHLLTFNQLLTNIRHLGHGGLRTNRYWIWKARQAEAQSQIWDDPRGYYFCNIVAVSPEAQARGIGRMLFEAVTKRADGEGVKCYLESSKKVPNVGIYERMGFEMRREMECRDGEDVCMLYCMVRDPRPQ